MICNKCNSTDITYNSIEGHYICDNCGNEIPVEFESVDYLMNEWQIEGLTESEISEFKQACNDLFNASKTINKILG